ncbi:GABA transporter 1-like isoform X2 [Carex rostrata]
MREEKEEEEGRGTWKHAAFHVATTIATPAAYAPLPFALASLGWPLGVCCLVGGTLTTWYSSLLIASLWKWDGNKHSTYRLLANSIFGPWGYWFIALFQQLASIGNNIAIQIAAGSSLKAVYKYYQNDAKLTLQDFIIFFGICELILSQFPDIHSLRWFNGICTFSTVGFAATATGVTIYDGMNTDRSSVNYNLQGTTASKILKAFSALGTIAFSFGDAILPEIQIYSRPTYALFEESTPLQQKWLKRCLCRLAYTSVYIIIITLISAAMPFFGDFVAICGAIGFTPLDFVFPALAFLMAGKMQKNSNLSLLVRVANFSIAALFSLVAVLGCIGAVRSIVLDVKTYKLFHDM